MICDIAIPIWNKKEFTERCINSILDNTSFPFRILLIDNASSEPTCSYLRTIANQYPDKIVLIRNKENLGNTMAGIQGMKYSDAEYVCILDNDTIVCRGWLEEMIRIAGLREDIGVVNPNSNTFGLKGPSSRAALEEFAKDLLRKEGGKFIEIGAAIGFCYLVKRKVINEIGYWDEGFSPGYFEDTEYSMRAKKYGYKSVIALGAYVYHDEHSSFKSKEKRKDFEKIFRASQERFFQLYGKPQRLLYVVRKGITDLDGFNNRLYKEADRGNFVDIIIPQRYASLNIIRHGNIRKIVLRNLCFNLKTWFRILTKKKRYNMVFYE